MKLDDWLKISTYKQACCTPEPDDIEMGITSNPGDYYFAVFTDPEGDFDNKTGKYTPGACACISPIKYFKEEGYMWDEHVLDYVSIPGFAEDMECIISPAAGFPRLKPNEMHNLLLEIGLKWSKEFADFTEKGSTGTVFYP